MFHGNRLIVKIFIAFMIDLLIFFFFPDWIVNFLGKKLLRIFTYPLGSINLCTFEETDTFPSPYGLALTGKDLYQSAKLEILSLSFVKQIMHSSHSLFFPEKKSLD